MLEKTIPFPSWDPYVQQICTTETLSKAFIGCSISYKSKGRCSFLLPWDLFEKVKGNALWTEPSNPTHTLVSIAHYRFSLSIFILFISYQVVNGNYEASNAIPIVKYSLSVYCFHFIVPIHSTLLSVRSTSKSIPKLNYQFHLPPLELLTIAFRCNCRPNPKLRDCSQSLFSQYPHRIQLSTDMSTTITVARS